MSFLASHIDLIKAATPILDRLADAAGETVELAMRSESNAVVVSHRPSKHAFRLVRPLGTVYPCYRGAAAGKVLLAWLPDARVRSNSSPRSHAAEATRRRPRVQSPSRARTGSRNARGTATPESP